MGFKRRQLGGSMNYVKYSECKVGDILVPQGKFIGTSPGYKGDVNKPNFKFQDVETGEITALNFAGQLAWIIENHVTEGDVVEIKFMGKDEDAAKPGENAPNNFEVNQLIDESLEEELAPVAKKSSTNVSLSDLD